jgi:hypothetical protein
MWNTVGYFRTGGKDILARFDVDQASIRSTRCWVANPRRQKSHRISLTLSGTRARARSGRRSACSAWGPVPFFLLARPRAGWRPGAPASAQRPPSPTCYAGTIRANDALHTARAPPRPWPLQRPVHWSTGSPQRAPRLPVSSHVVPRQRRRSALGARAEADGPRASGPSRAAGDARGATSPTHTSGVPAFPLPHCVGPSRQEAARSRAF